MASSFDSGDCPIEGEVVNIVFRNAAYPVVASINNAKRTIGILERGETLEDRVFWYGTTALSSNISYQHADAKNGANREDETEHFHFQLCRQTIDHSNKSIRHTGNLDLPPFVDDLAHT